MRLLGSILLLMANCSLEAQQMTCKVSATYVDLPLNLVFNDLSNQCEVQFAYDSYAVRSAKITATFENVALNLALEKILSQHQLSFKEISKTIVIIPEQEFETIAKDSTATAVPAVEQFLIRGEIRSAETNEILPFANVQLYTTSQGTTSNSDGKFAFTIENTKNDSIEISYIGFEPLLIAVSAIKENTYRKYYLEERKSYLPSIIIDAERIKLIQIGPKPSQLILDPNNLAIAQGTGEPDVMRAAQLLPGISATQESSSGLFIRGSASDQTLITLDGFTLYHLDHFFGTFTALNTNAVKTMRLMKGSLEAEYGNRIAGVAEVIGKEGNLKKKSAQIDIGALSIGGVLEGPLDKKGKASFILTGRRAYTDLVFSPTYKGIFNTTYNAAITTSASGNEQTFGGAQDPQFYFGDANVKLTYRPNDKTIFNLSGYTGKDHLFISYADTSDDEVINLTDKKYLDESTWQNAGVGARWNTEWTSKLSTELQAGCSVFKTNFFTRDSTFSPLSQTFEASDFNNEQTSVNDFNLKLLSFYRTKNHLTKTGIQLNNITTERAFGENSPLNSAQSQSGTITSFFIQDEWKIGKHWTLYPGIRVSIYNLTNVKAYPEQRINLMRSNMKGTFTWKFSVSRVHQFIHRIRSQSLYLNNPDYWKLSKDNELPVKNSDQFVAGFIFKKKNFTLDAEAYAKTVNRNSTYLGVYNGYSQTFATDTFNTQGLIVGNGTALGADFLLQYDEGRHHAWAGYSILEAQTRYEELDNEIVPESFADLHEFKIYYEVETKRWDFSLLWVYGSGKPYTPYLGNYYVDLLNGEQRKIPMYGDLNSAQLPAYHRLDAGLSYSFVLGDARGKIALSCYNIYNQRNVRDRQYLIQRFGNEPNDYNVVQREVYMLGVLPSLSIQFKF